MSGAAREDLWTVVRRDERYEQMRRGELGNDLAWEFQCFACAFYRPLRGEQGMDWGICANPASPRAGLLNFEHYGCEAFHPVAESA